MANQLWQFVSFINNGYNVLNTTYESSTMLSTLQTLLNFMLQHCVKPNPTSYLPFSHTYLLLGN